MIDLCMDPSCSNGLKSNCQIARRVTEGWASKNLYCPSCDSDRVQSTRHNTEAVDFTCPHCSAAYQLKASRAWNERKIPDAGFHAMMRALSSDSVPNLLLMQYTANWYVRNLMIVPSFFFSPAAIEKRKPLAPTARRAGWVGCNILLSKIADIGKIRVVSNGQPAEVSAVRTQYASVRPLAKLNVEVRGWTLDVLRLVRNLGQQNFSIKDAYQFAPELSRLHPKNRNVRPKIRQQLQVLRDLGFIRFLARGEYEMLN